MSIVFLYKQQKKTTHPQEGMGITSQKMFVLALLVLNREAILKSNWQKLCSNIGTRFCSAPIFLVFQN